MDGLTLTQQPVREMATLREGMRRQYAGSFESAARWLGQQEHLSSLLDVHFVFHDIGATPFRIDWRTGPNEFSRIVVDPQAGRLLLDRSQSGLKNFNASFPGTYAAPLHIDRGRVDVQLLIDASSIEVLANGGEVSMTSLIFPTGADRALTITSDGAGRGPEVSVAIQPLHRALQP